MVLRRWYPTMKMYSGIHGRNAVVCFVLKVRTVFYVPLNYYAILS